MKDKIIEEIAIKLRYEMKAIEHASQQGGMSESELKTLWNNLSDLVSKMDTNEEIEDRRSEQPEWKHNKIHPIQARDRY